MTSVNEPMKLLNLQNYKSGFLVDDEAIAGVTEMAGNVYAAYVSDSATGETLAYREFDTPNEALDFLLTINRSWTYEAVGCDSKTQPKDAAVKQCDTNGCAGCACG